MNSNIHNTNDTILISNFDVSNHPQPAIDLAGAYTRELQGEPQLNENENEFKNGDKFNHDNINDENEGIAYVKKIINGGDTNDGIVIYDGETQSQVV